MSRQSAGVSMHNDNKPDTNPLLGDGDVNEEQDGGEFGGARTTFVKSKGLSSAQADALMLQYGRNELEEKKTPKWYIFLSQLWQPMPCMLWLAAIVEAAIENYEDMGVLVGIQFANASLSYYETVKADDAVAALRAALKPLAHVKRDGKTQTMDAALLVPGDLVILGSGGAVPADCVLNEGQVDIDQAALTGESLPVTMHEGDEPKMGSTVVRGETEATVAFTGSDTFLGKTAAMLQGPAEISNLQKLLIRIMLVLVMLSIVLCSIVLLYLCTHGEDFTDALSFAVVLLVASIPVAIEIVCTTTLALGSHELSSEGAIVSRLAAIEDMAGMTILCSDKTGTLTLNKMMIQEETPIYYPGETQASLLRYAAMAAKWNDPPRDALDTLVLGAVDMQSMEACQALDYMPFDPVVKRTEGTISENGGPSFKCTKGAPHVILKLCNDPAVEAECEAHVTALGQRGIRAMGIAKTDETGAWKMRGLLTFLDPPRPDTKSTIHKAIEYGIGVKMITGDHLLIAKETARQLDMGTDIHTSTNLPMLEKDGSAPANLMTYSEHILPADGFAQVFPEHKYLVVEVLRRLGHKTGMTGDGVNDAPALKRADVGVAVHGATDAARAAADIVLTRPGLSTIVDATIISRKVFQRIKNFLAYRIAATLQLISFFFVAVILMHPESYIPNKDSKDYPGDDIADEFPKFFKMPVLMLMLITLLNDGTLISIGYDNVKASPMPLAWNLPALYTIAASQAFIACISSLLLLDMALDSWNEGSIFHSLGLRGLEYGQVTTMMYFKVSVSDFLTLFSARTPDGPFYSVAPSRILLCAGAFATCLSTILASAWPESHPDHIDTIGLARVKPRLMPLYVWIYCFVMWLFEDAFKVLTIYTLKRFNIFGINDASSWPKILAAHEKKYADSYRKPLASGGGLV